MTIVRSYPEELSKKQSYDLTMNPKTQKMLDAVGTVLDIAAWCHYKDNNGKDGAEQDIMSILTPEGEIYATNSETFRKDFFRMVDLFGPDGVDCVEVITGTSKAGRPFVDCAYAGK